MTDSSSDKLRILVVDDSRVILKAFAKIIGNDYDIITAGDGEEAWEIIEKDQNITTVFTDMLMPELDGLGLLKRIREAQSSIIQSLPVILVTSADDEDVEVQEAFTLGVTDMVRKPFDRLLLQACAKAHVKPRHMPSDNDNESASIDPITQLANKAYFAEHGKKDLAFAQRSSHPISVSIFKIDKYSQLNDIYTEEIGNLLTQVGSFIRSTIRQEDTLAHFGSGEYGLITVGNEHDEIKNQLERIQSTLKEKTFNLNDVSAKCTVCIGFTTLDIGEETDFSTLVNKANNSLTTAIEKGINELATSDVEKPAGSSNKLENSILTVLNKMLVMINKSHQRLDQRVAKNITAKLLSIILLLDQKFNLGLEDTIETMKNKLQ